MAIQEGDTETLRRLAEGKIVLFPAEAGQGQHGTPTGQAMSDMVIQAHVLNTILTGRWLRGTPLSWTIAGAVILSTLGAFLVLVWPWWAGLAAAASLGLGYAGSVLLAPRLAGVVLPVF